MERVYLSALEPRWGPASMNPTESGQSSSVECDLITLFGRQLLRQLTDFEPRTGQNPS